MGTRIYVGNLPWSTTSDDLERMFEAHGAVDSATVITDRETGRSRGFGFVEMTDADEARRAIQEMDGNDLSGRKLTVNVARERTDRGGGGYRR